MAYDYIFDLAESCDTVLQARFPSVSVRQKLIPNHQGEEAKGRLYIAATVKMASRILSR